MHERFILSYEFSYEKCSEIFPEFIEPLFCGSEKNPAKFPPNFPPNFPAKNQKKITDELLQGRRENIWVWRILGESPIPSRPKLLQQNLFTKIIFRGNSFCVIITKTLCIQLIKQTRERAQKILQNNSFRELFCKNFGFEEFFWEKKSLGLVPASVPHTLGYTCTLYTPTSPLPKLGLFFIWAWRILGELP